MKILNVIASADRRDGGPVEGVFRLGDAFRAMGHSHELMTIDPPGMVSDNACPSIVHAKGKVRPRGAGPASRLRNWARYSPEATAWLKENAPRYDGIIVDGLWNYSTRAARLALPGSATPYVVFPHGMLDPWFRRRYPLKHAAKSMLWRFNEGPLLRDAAAIAFTCERERALARQNWAMSGMQDRVVGYGTAMPPAFTREMDAAFRESVPALASRPYILFLSRLHPKKGAENLIRSFSRVAGKPDLQLVMAGPGERNEVARLKSLADASGLRQRIHWPGMLSGAAKWGALYGCDAMALISHQENFGVVVAEAAACARPVLISDQVNIAPEIRRGGAGLVCADDLASASLMMRAFATLPDTERAAMGQNAYRVFDESFRIERVAEKLLTIFEEARLNRFNL